MVINSNGERTTTRYIVLIEHYRKLGTPTTNEKCDAKFDKEIIARAMEIVDASKRE